MSCPNKINDDALSNMRRDYLESLRHMQHYKKLYSQELVNTQKVKKLLLKCQREMQRISSTCTHLESKLKRYRVNNPGPSERRHRKDWDKIKCDRTKQRRFNYYKDSIFSTLKEISVCH